MRITSKLKTAGLAVLALAGSLLPATQASATHSFADCPYHLVSGTALYSPALQATNPLNTPGAWTIKLTMTCLGTSPAAGTYNLTLSGGNTETCTTGTANGTITGTGPLGAVRGTTGYQRVGIHLYGFAPYATSTFTSGGQTFQLAIWLDVIANPPCPLAFGTVIGHAAITHL
jgi:hypothetical protein